LVNEAQQFEQRYVKFNLEKLCDLVAKVAGNGSAVRSIEKMEGGFNKALLMATEDGSRVTAKIPCSNAGRPMYSTASEAALLEYGERSDADVQGRSID
jgi:hypothetical protein